MTQQGKLTLLALALGAALVTASATAPAWADEAPAGSQIPADPAARQAEGKPAPQERRTPPPAQPSGCPFRDGKLELIA